MVIGHHELRRLDQRYVATSGNGGSFETNGERVLKDFNLRVPSGQKPGSPGLPVSGAGKSTILALAQRLPDPEVGYVLVDEQDVRNLTQESLR